MHGGAGGIGSFAIQYAKARGCTVAATAGTEEKLEICRELGADIALDYHDDWAAQLREATEGRGVDVILDVMGAKYLEPNVRSLTRGGRLVLIGLQGGVKGELNLGALLSKRAAVSATSLRARPLSEKASIVAAVREHVWPLLEGGHVRPVVDRELPMSDAAAAHRVVEESGHVGKVLLVVP